jgi:FdhD protein
VSGRASFELLPEGVDGGVPVLAAVSAPARLRRPRGRGRLTLVGFLRGATMNVYAGEARVAA